MKVLAWPPLQIVAVNKNKISGESFGRGHFLRSAGEISLSGKRGA